jgi:hypothetical protein
MAQVMSSYQIGDARRDLAFFVSLAATYEDSS